MANKFDADLIMSTLIEYIQYVVSCEGTDFIRGSEGAYTREQVEVLKYAHEESLKPYQKIEVK